MNMKRRTIIKAGLCALLFWLGFAGVLWALPAYRRLWERKYGYKMSCAICHVKGGGSEITGYGKDFQRFGMTPASFNSIEKRDSDGDGFTNKKEIQARSNPGDHLSTPENKKDWLKRIEQAILPLDQLEELFPEASKFSSLEGTLLDKQVQEVEKALGGKLSPEDTVPMFYFSVEKSGNKFKRTGVALFLAPTDGAKKLIVAVGLDLSGKITRVLLVKNKEDKRLSDEKFLTQFTGKSVSDSFEMGKDIQPVPDAEKSSERVAEVARKALLIIQAVFSKKK